MDSTAEVGVTALLAGEGVLTAVKALPTASIPLALEAIDEVIDEAATVAETEADS
jgi:hypothetical protein